DYFSVFPVLHPSGRGGDGALPCMMSYAANKRCRKAPLQIESPVAQAQSFYKLLIRRAEPFFPTVAPSEGMTWSTCVSFSEAVFCSPREAKLSSGGPADQGAALLTAVCQCLARFGVHVVKIPLRVLESFEQVLHPAQPRVLTPAWLRQFLRAVGASNSSRGLGADHGKPSIAKALYVPRRLSDL
ncbi:SACS, partial [Symbiodinium sp. KB8]